MDLKSASKVTNYGKLIRSILEYIEVESCRFRIIAVIEEPIRRPRIVQPEFRNTRVAVGTRCACEMRREVPG